MTFSPDEPLPERLSRIQTLLTDRAYLPDEKPGFPEHPLRIHLVRGIRRFQELSGESWDLIEVKLEQEPYRLNWGGDSLTRTTLNELRRLTTDAGKPAGDADPAKRPGRPIASQRRRLIKLTLFFVSAYYPRFDVQEKDGELVFLDRNQPIPIDPPSRDRQYIAYYWRHGNRRSSERVGVAVIAVPDGHWNRATMTLHYRDGSEIALRTTRGQVIDNILYLQLDDTDGTDTCQPNVLTQLTIDFAYERQPLLLGTYSTVHRPSVDPTAGLMVWQVMRTAAECETHIRQYLADDEAIPAEIRYYLTFQRFDVEGKSIGSLAELPYADDVRRLTSTFAGRYQGYLINPTTEEVDLFRCAISTAGRVVCTFADEGTPCEEVGYLRFVNSAVRIDMDYQDKHTRFRYNFFLQDRLAERADQLYWLGIRAGFTGNLSEPMSGRVVLQRADNPVWATCDAVELVERPDGPILRDFLSGVDGAVHKFTDSFAHDLFRDVMPNAFRIDQFAGEYDCFMNGRQLINNTTRIYRYQLTIGGNGQTKLVGNGKRAWGTASVYRGKYLSIQFDRHGEKGFFGSLILSLLHGEVEIKSRAEVKHLFGALVKMDNQRIEATSVVLQPVAVPGADAVPPVVPDHFFRSRDLPGNDIDYARFDNWDGALDGLLSFLDGQSYRFMRLPRTPNRPFRPRKENYRRVSFYAACYVAGLYARDHDAMQLVTIRTNLRDCYHHGFAAERFAGELITVLATEAGQNDYFSKQAISVDYRADLRADFAGLLADQRLLAEALPAVLAVHPEVTALVEKLWPHLTGEPLRNRPPDAVKPAQNRNGSGPL